MYIHLYICCKRKKEKKTIASLCFSLLPIKKTLNSRMEKNMCKSVGKNELELCMQTKSKRKREWPRDCCNAGKKQLSSFVFLEQPEESRPPFTITSYELFSNHISHHPCRLTLKLASSL